jgi:catechol 2,3-dioxygenase-like lactoylglutathione lyase family enzyme
MPIRAIDHIDLAVADVERSLQFYLRVLGPLGVEELMRYPSYRGTEEIVYLRVGNSGQVIGLRQADGGEHRYYDVGLEHLALSVDSREEVDEAYRRCLEAGARIHFPPEEDRDIPGYVELFFRPRRLPHRDRPPGPGGAGAGGRGEADGLCGRAVALPRAAGAVTDRPPTRT